jgi:hypothetical protein
VGNGAVASLTGVKAGSDELIALPLATLAPTEETTASSAAGTDLPSLEFRSELVVEAIFADCTFDLEDVFACDRSASNDVVEFV